LMAVALSKIAFLPFGFLVDKWRWQVFQYEAEEAAIASNSGSIKHSDAGKYNRMWWDLRLKYQGITPPLEEWNRFKDEAYFDPGAKYHVASNTPYMRYFLSHILQFQFHKALCDASGYVGPLHKCSINGSSEAGSRLKAMLALGASKPWQVALQQLTGGTGELNSSVILEYFEPLVEWLHKQNANETCGWRDEWVKDEVPKWYDHEGMVLELAISGAFAFIILLAVILLVRHERKQHASEQAKRTSRRAKEKRALERENERRLVEQPLTEQVSPEDDEAFELEVRNDVAAPLGEDEA
jgi:hypothetical protein